jgi:anaerobic magnesium-protoporphyrin IX monomethyl ester cyclase
VSGTAFIIISQSEVVNYAEYSKLPLDRLPLYTDLVYPRMVYYKNGFRSHLDILNWLSFKTFWNEAGPAQRRKLLSIWNLPGFTGIHLANYLRQFGITTHIINNFDAEWDIFCKIYESCDPKPLVGISTTFHLNYSELRRLTKRLLQAYPDISLVAGGAFINDQIQRSAAGALGKALSKYKIDFAVHSFNSEVDLKNLILLRKNGDRDLENVKNLGYIARRDGETALCLTESVWNPPQLEVQPFWDQLELPLVNHTIQMRTSSGCPFACAFCSYPELAHGFHPVPSELVEKHLQSVLNLPNINKIIFIDDTFNVPIPRFKELLKLFARYNFEWFSFLRVQFVDDEIARLMKESGARGVYLGIESASDTVLQNMNKKATRKKFEAGINCLKKYDITTMAAFVLGFPGETDETIREDIEFIEGTGVDFYTLKEFYYQENTPIYRQRREYGLTGMANKWAHNTMDSATAFAHKISMFRQIKNSVFVDPDTSLWYLAYLYDQGFDMQDIAEIQGYINRLMVQQLDGHLDDTSPIYARISERLAARQTHHG